MADSKKPAAKSAAKKPAAKKAAGKGGKAACPPLNVNNAEKVLNRAAHTPAGQEAIAHLKKKGAAAKKPAAKKPAAKKPAAAKAAPAKKPAAKKPAAKKPAAKKPAAAAAAPAPAPAAAPAKKPAAKKPAADKKLVADRFAAMERLAAGTKSQFAQVNQKIEALIAARTPAAASKKKTPPKRRSAAQSKDLSLNEAVKAVAAGLNGVSEAKVREAMDQLAKANGLPRAANPVANPSHGHPGHPGHPGHYENNPTRLPNPMYTAGQIGVALATVGVGFTLVDMLDRTIATYAPGDCKVYGDEAVQRLAQRPGLYRMGVQVGVTGLGFVGSWWAYKKGHAWASAVAGGLGTAAGIHLVFQGLTEYVMPMIFSAKDAKEETVGNRLYPTQQKYVQDFLDDLIKKSDDACKAKATKLVRQGILQSYYAKRFNIAAAPALGNGGRSAGVAGPPAAPRPPTPALPAQVYAAPGQAGTGAPARGEPRATASADGGAGVAGCGGKCGKNSPAGHKPCAGCAKKHAAEAPANPEFYKLESGEWYDGSGELLGSGDMAGRDSALAAGVRWFQKSTGKFFLADGKTEYTAPAAGVAAAPAAEPVAAPAAAPAAAAGVAAAPASVDGSAVPAGKRVEVVELSDGTRRVVFVDDSHAAGVAAAPAAAPAAPVADPRLDAVLDAVKTLSGSIANLDARVSVISAKAEAGVAAPPVAPVAAPHVVSSAPVPVAKAAAPAAPAAPEMPLASTGSDDAAGFDPFAMN